MNKIKAEIAARCLGDARTNPRLAERAALVTGAGKSDTGPLTVEPDVGKITVCRQRRPTARTTASTGSAVSLVFGQQRRTCRGAARALRGHHSGRSRSNSPMPRAFHY